MMDHLEQAAKICQTATGILLVDHRVLLIKHKKLGTWLSPGGHVEEGEFLHEAAEREFFEETGLKVQAINPFTKDINNQALTGSIFQPTPITINLHWVSESNYRERIAGRKQHDTMWANGCEQHLNFSFLVKATAGLKFKQNIEETDGIAWFSLAEVKAAKQSLMFNSVKQELLLAFKLV